MSRHHFLTPGDKECLYLIYLTAIFVLTTHVRILGTSQQCCESVTFWYGSVPLTYGFGSGLFRQQLTRYQQKISFFNVFFCLLFEGTFASASINKKSKRIHKIVEIKVFLFFFLLMEGSGSARAQKTYGSGFTTLPLRSDLDPQHQIRRARK